MRTNCFFFFPVHGGGVLARLADSRFNDGITGVAEAGGKKLGQFPARSVFKAHQPVQHALKTLQIRKVKVQANGAHHLVPTVAQKADGGLERQARRRGGGKGKGVLHRVAAPTQGLGYHAGDGRAHAPSRQRTLKVNERMLHIAEIMYGHFAKRPQGAGHHAGHAHGIGEDGATFALVEGDAGAAGAGFYGGRGLGAGRRRRGRGGFLLRHGGLPWGKGLWILYSIYQ